MNPNDKVLMRNDLLPGREVWATYGAFKNAWESKGWVLVPEGNASSVTTSDPGPSMDLADDFEAEMSDDED